MESVGKRVAVILVCGMAITAAVGSGYAQESTISADSGFAAAVTQLQRQLADSLNELNTVRERIAGEQVPLSRKLNDLERELGEVRTEYQKTSRTLDSRTLDLSNLRSEIKSRQEEATYLSNLLGEYIRNFESRVHISELQRYREAVETARLAPENSNLTPQQVYQAQTGLLQISLERMTEALGGVAFDGSAVVGSGLVRPGRFVLIGPAAYFRSGDGEYVGTVEQRLGSLEPTVIGFERSEDAAAASQFITNGSGSFPLDPTLGNAHKIEATKESLGEHIKKGGPVMIPIFGLAGAALLVALYKWISLSLLPLPSRKKMADLLRSVEQADAGAAAQKAKAMGGPAGAMLLSGIEHIRESRELIEEVMYETVMNTKLKVQGLLPFIGICASSAPLLGLLGTVTGIINTFKLITVFGSGDVKTLSGGISEALITTKFGLIVAIPSLLLHAFLSRKAKGIIDQMEKAAVSFVNQVTKTSYVQARNAARGPAARTERFARTNSGDKVEKFFYVHKYPESENQGNEFDTDQIT